MVTTVFYELRSACQVLVKRLIPNVVLQNIMPVRLISPPCGALTFRHVGVLFRIRARSIHGYVHRGTK